LPALTSALHSKLNRAKRMNSSQTHSSNPLLNSILVRCMWITYFLQLRPISSYFSLLPPFLNHPLYPSLKFTITHHTEYNPPRDTSALHSSACIDLRASYRFDITASRSSRFSFRLFLSLPRYATRGGGRNLTTAGNPSKLPQKYGPDATAKKHNDRRDIMIVYIFPLVRVWAGKVRMKGS
jgi:hypothetical protein